MLKSCSMCTLLPIVAVCCMWGSRAICEDGFYSIGKAGLRDLPRAMTAIGWFGLSDFLRPRRGLLVRNRSSGGDGRRRSLLSSGRIRPGRICRWHGKGGWSCISGLKVRSSWKRANSRFLHCGGKCAAFGRNDRDLGFEGREQTTTLQLQKATADFSTAAASAPPSVEMTGFGFGRENRQRQMATADSK
jgi:hypothetical protein